MHCVGERAQEQIASVQRGMNCKQRLPNKAIASSRECMQGKSVDVQLEPCVALCLREEIEPVLLRLPRRAMQTTWFRPHGGASAAVVVKESPVGRIPLLREATGRRRAQLYGGARDAAAVAALQPQRRCALRRFLRAVTVGPHPAAQQHRLGARAVLEVAAAIA